MRQFWTGRHAWVGMGEERWSKSPFVSLSPEFSAAPSFMCESTRVRNASTRVHVVALLQRVAYSSPSCAPDGLSFSPATGINASNSDTY